MTSALAVCAAFAGPAHAGTLSAPAPYEIWSTNGRFVAELDPIRVETRVYRIEPDAARTQLWFIDGWYRVADLSDDGNHLVVGSDDLGLVRLDYDPADPVLRVYVRMRGRGHLVRSVTLGEIVPDATDLIRTTSYYDWGHYAGFDNDGRYVLETADGRRLRVDVTAGAVLH